MDPGMWTEDDAESEGVFFGFSRGFFSPAGDAEADARKETARFGVLRTDEGVEYRNVKVVRVEPDSLIIQHDDGMARVPLFDLSPEIQARFAFDPFKGMKHFKEETQRQRELRWRLFWEGERYKAEQMEKEERARIIESAKLNWVPVEASVLRRVPDGVLARCRRVVLFPPSRRVPWSFAGWAGGEKARGFFGRDGGVEICS